MTEKIELAEVTIIIRCNKDLVMTGPLRDTPKVSIGYATNGGLKPDHLASIADTAIFDRRKKRKAKKPVIKTKKRKYTKKSKYWGV